MTLKERAKKLKRDVPAVFLALKDRETPLLAKITAAVTVAYALSPIDLIAVPAGCGSQHLCNGLCHTRLLGND